MGLFYVFILSSFYVVLLSYSNNCVKKCSKACFIKIRSYLCKVNKAQ